MSKKKIAPSILSADLARLDQEIIAAEKGGADWFHVDVMDGHFAPTITVGPLVVSALKKITQLPLDVHLMIEDPDKYIETFSKAGADIITVPIETCLHLHRTVHFIKEKGCQVGVCLNPATPLSILECILPDVDLVTLLMVNPGFKGQKFNSALLSKIRSLCEMIHERGLQVDIEADGCISLDNIGQASGAGADIFVAGTAVFSSNNYGETISRLRNLAESL